MKKLLLPVLLLLSASVSFAQTAAPQPKMASEQEVRQLFAVLHLEQLVTSMIHNMVDSMGQIQEQAFGDGKAKIDADDRTFISNTQKELLDKMIDHQFIDEMLKAEVPIYTKHLTSADVQAAIAFYSSPAGQRYYAAMPSIQKEAVSVMMPTLTQRAQWFASEFSSRLNDYLKKKYGAAAPTLP